MKLRDFKKEEVQKVALRHIAEIYLYEYYIAGEAEYEIQSDEEFWKHLDRGKGYMEEGDYEAALRFLKEAHELNPVHTEVLLRIIRCYIHLQDAKNVLQYTTKLYPYCCTRAELAGYYRSLGWYYLTTYQPEVAVACYQYSNCFTETESATKEIEFLESAMKRSMKYENVEEMQEVLATKDIPCMANQVSLALLYQAGLEARNRGIISQAYDCFAMVYNLTQDEEVGKFLQELKAEA